jgi:hypothetical protein
MITAAFFILSLFTVHFSTIAGRLLPGVKLGGWLLTNSVVKRSGIVLIRRENLFQEGHIVVKNKRADDWVGFLVWLK